jgi:CheY-like chemotaxis protein
MKRILLADDNPHIREFCKQQLERDDIRVVLAQNGLEAVQLAEREPVDLAILDIGMPIVDGYEAAARIRAIAPELPILFFSSRPIARPALSELAAASIEKSNDLAELKEAVMRLLGCVMSANDTFLARPR